MAGRYGAGFKSSGTENSGLLASLVLQSGIHHA